MRRLNHIFKAAGRTVALSLVLLVAASFVPGDDLYYRVERLLSLAGPLGAATQHIRSVPATLNSILLEGSQDRLLNVEGVPVNLEFAVNATEHVREERFFSRELGERRTYWVYVPPGYDQSSERYPTLYLLHGMSQNHMWWTEVARIDRIVTSMIEQGKLRPVILVMPNGNRDEKDESTTSLYDNGCSTGLDMIARLLTFIGDRLPDLRIYNISCSGDFDQYIAKELVEDVGRRYRTTDERYVGGFSLGGRGAVQLALANSGVFDGAFGLSGNYDFLRKAMRSGDIGVSNGLKLFVAAGDYDQRGVYGTLNTFLFHRDLAQMGVQHLYCTYEGTHSDVGWVVAIPQAIQYLLGAGDVEVAGCQGECGPEDSCKLAQPGGLGESGHPGKGAS